MVRAPRHAGFSLIELMIVVVIIGILAAIAIPMFTDSSRKAKTGEALLQLNRMAKGAKSWHHAQSEFPEGTATPMPGSDGGACASPGKKFPVTTAWTGDSAWTSLSFQIDEPNLFTYHYMSADGSSASATAVGDLDCDGTLITYTLALGSSQGVPSSILTEPPKGSD